MGARPPGYAYVWEYTIRPECRADFEDAYGPRGQWAQLFRRAGGYLRTELHRDRQEAHRYLTIDYWESAAAWERFREAFADEFEALDTRCEAFTEHERELGRLDPVP